MADNTMSTVDQKLRNGIFVMAQAGDLVAADSKMMPRIMKLFDEEGANLPMALLGKNLVVEFNFSQSIDLGERSDELPEESKEPSQKQATGKTTEVDT
jgi:hypothetical protein